MIKLNKITSVLLSAIMVIGIFSIIPFAAGAETSGSFEYDVLDDGTAYITKYIDKGSKTVDIPSTIDGYKVTEIGNYAFEGCTGLTSVIIPNSVTNIEGGAFRGCTGLKSITVDKNNKNYISVDGVLFNKNKTKILGYPNAKGSSYVIPSSVTEIGYYAFSGCTGLTSVTIPSSVTEIGWGAFYGCTGLKSVTILSSVTVIGGSAFRGCTSLKSITVDKNNKNYTSVNGVLFNKNKTEILVYPNAKSSSYVIPTSVKVIGASAFYGCTGLKSVTIPSSVKEIGRCAFEGCTGLTSVTIPSGVTVIGECAFSDCTGLKSITVDKNNKNYTSVDGVLFNKNKTEILIYPNAKGSSYVIPSSVKKICNYAFDGCTGLKSVTIPNSVTEIGENAFMDCTGLTSVSIPSSVTEIGVCAFYGCTGLKSVTIPNSVTEIGGGAFQGCTGLKSVTIPSSVTEIGWRAFENCTGLKNITIPNSVTYIGVCAFRGCTGLKSVTIPSSVTKIGDISFGYVDSQNKIKGFTIYGTKGTAAERYANDNGFKFVEGTAPAEPVVPTGVKLNQSSLTLGKGESYGLVSTVLPANAKNKTCTWSTSNSSVATVSNTGKVTAKAIGTAVITVKTVNGKTATCKVTVKPAPTSVKINPTALTLGKGESYTVSESTSKGSYANGANLKWTSTNTRVATVQKGKGNKAVIKAVGTGTANIKITLFNGKTATCKVTVKPAPTSVKINPTAITLGKGESYTVSESTSKGSYANGANLKWTSTNTRVATVQKGKGNKAVIKAVGTGTANIKITLFNGKTATCKVTVKPAPTSVKINPTALTLGKGESYTISESTSKGSYANGANLKWTSTNTRVATVQKGKGNKAVIKAVGTGTANIKITLFNGKTATCKVTV
ncbi:leucine-rich repeat protein, partial [Oscillospiraceae bacterium LCP25S3_E4]